MMFKVYDKKLIKKNMKIKIRKNLKMILSDSILIK